MLNITITPQERSLLIGALDNLVRTQGLQAAAPAVALAAKLQAASPKEDTDDAGS